MTDYNLPADIRVELRVANKWFAMAGAAFILGFSLYRPAILAGIGLASYAMVLDFKAKKKAKQWRRENGYAP